MILQFQQAKAGMGSGDYLIMKQVLLALLAMIAAGGAAIGSEAAKSKSPAQDEVQNEVRDETRDAAAGGYTWSFIDLDGQAVANYAACGQCDDIDLALYCAVGEDIVLITATMDIVEGEDLDAADIEFRFGEERIITREGYLEFNAMDDLLQPVVEVRYDDELIEAMATGTELEISVRGQQKSFVLENAEPAILGMLDICLNE